MDAKGLYEGVSRLLAVSPAREIPEPANHSGERAVSENGEGPVLENGDSSSITEPPNSNSDENEKPTSETDENRSST